MTIPNKHQAKAEPGNFQLWEPTRKGPYPSQAGGKTRKGKHEKFGTPDVGGIEKV